MWFSSMQNGKGPPERGEDHQGEKYEDLTTGARLPFPPQISQQVGHPLQGRRRLDAFWHEGDRRDGGGENVIAKECLLEAVW